METRLSRLLRRHHLPQPVRPLDSPESREVEVRDALGFIGRVDFAYPELKIAIEVQSHRLRRGRNWDSIDGTLTGPPGARIWTG